MNRTAGLILLCLASTPLLTVACERDGTAVASAEVRELQSTFGQELEHEEALRFGSLSSELKAALTDQAQAFGPASALSYLEEMPDTTPPLGSLVMPEEMELFLELDSGRQRIVLLEGYTRGWERWRYDRPPAGNARFALLGPMIRGAHAYLFPDGDKVPLKSLDEALTPSEKAKLESMDPRLSSIFSRAWQARRVSPGLVDRLEGQLKRHLADAPTTMPQILDSDLVRTRWGSLWEEYPETLDFARQYLAQRFVSGRVFEHSGLDALDKELMRLNDSKSRELFAAGFVTGDRREFPEPLVCEWDASTGVWFEWAVPSTFRRLGPQELVLTVPLLETVLSDPARERLESLDTQLRGRFEESWYMSSGSAQAMACFAMRKDRYLAQLPLTQLPDMSTLLTPESLSLFEGLSEGRQQYVIEFAAMLIVDGEIRIGGLHGQPKHEVAIYGMSRGELIRELRTTAEIAVNIVAAWDS